MAAQAVHVRFRAGAEIHMSLDRYRACHWDMNGMDYPALNCWGLVRLARHELFGLPMLPATSIPADDKRGMTAATHEIKEMLERTDGRPGAIATCWRGRICEHVALVVRADGRMMVMDIDDGRPMRLTPIFEFEKKWLRVEYFT